MSPEDGETACALLRACLDLIGQHERNAQTRNAMWAPFAADTLAFLDSVGELPAGFAERLALSWARRRA